MSQIGSFPQTGVKKKIFETTTQNMFETITSIKSRETKKYVSHAAKSWESKFLPWKPFWQIIYSRCPSQPLHYEMANQIQTWHNLIYTICKFYTGIDVKSQYCHNLKGAVGSFWDYRRFAKEMVSISMTLRAKPLCKKAGPGPGTGFQRNKSSVFHGKLKSCFPNKRSIPWDKNMKTHSHIICI